MRKQLRAAAGLTGFPPENIFICEHKRGCAKREGYEQTDAAEGETNQVEYANQNRQSKDVKPMLMDNLPTDLHSRPKADLSVHDEREGEDPVYGKIGSRNHANAEHRQSGSQRREQL